MDIDKIVKNIEGSLKGGSQFVDLIGIKKESQQKLLDIKNLLQEKDYKCSYTKESPSYVLRPNNEYFKLRVENVSKN
jgi:hypothetical protein